MPLLGNNPNELFVKVPFETVDKFALMVEDMLLGVVLGFAAGKPETVVEDVELVFDEDSEAKVEVVLESSEPVAPSPSKMRPPRPSLTVVLLFDRAVDIV